MDRTFILDFTPSKWTLGAVQCYKIGCKCEECYIKHNYKSLANRCMMKYSVRYLVENFGLPEHITLEKIIQEDTE